MHIHGHLATRCGEQLPHPFHHTPEKQKEEKRGEKENKTNATVTFPTPWWMLFSHVLPQDQTLPLCSVLPPFCSPCLLVPPFLTPLLTWVAATLISTLTSLWPLSVLLTSPAMAAAEEGAQPLMYQVCSSGFILISRYILQDVIIFVCLLCLFLVSYHCEILMRFPWFGLCCSSSDCGSEGQHPLWGLQEEGQEGATDHRR